MLPLEKWAECTAVALKKMIIRHEYSDLRRHDLTLNIILLIASQFGPWSVAVYLRIIISRGIKSTVDFVVLIKLLNCLNIYKQLAPGPDELHKMYLLYYNTYCPRDHKIIARYILNIFKSIKYRVFKWRKWSTSSIPTGKTISNFLPFIYIST